MSEILKLADGRNLEYINNGVSGNRAVVLHHGTPSTAATWQFWLDELTKLGIRAVAISRAGYGKSSRNQNTTLAKAVADTAALLNHLGIVDFVSVGWSGGGPSALADGLLENCIASNTIAGLSSLTLQGESFFNDLPESNIKEIEETLQGWDVAFAHKAKYVTELNEGREAGSAAWWEKRERIEEFRSDYDAFGLVLSRTMSDAVADDGNAWQDDESRFFADWGFTLDQIKAPVHVWQGGLDTAVPEQMGRWLAANIPGAALTLYPDETHTSIMIERRAEIFEAIQKQLGKN